MLDDLAWDTNWARKADPARFGPDPGVGMQLILQRPRLFTRPRPTTPAPTRLRLLPECKENNLHRTVTTRGIPSGEIILAAHITPTAVHERELLLQGG